MDDILYYLLLIAFLAAAVVGGAVLWRTYLDGTGPGSSLFKSRTEPRLDIVEQSSVDGRRRLVLIRRDDTEHLIMTGGPVDVVIETGIKAPSTRARGSADVVEPPVFSRQPRPLGQAVGEQ
ncbi:MAG: flagellar biosynthetic protein FliO [Hyphomicrobiaceae bacterium]|nr:flagellar biosynthetic protein FliO [Hyphomicrobiaceae bacterium]